MLTWQSCRQWDWQDFGFDMASTKMIKIEGLTKWKFSPNLEQENMLLRLAKMGVIWPADHKAVFAQKIWQKIDGKKGVRQFDAEFFHERQFQLDTIVLQGLKDELQVANPEFSTDSLPDVERSLGETAVNPSNPRTPRSSPWPRRWEIRGKSWNGWWWNVVKMEWEMLEFG